MTVNVTGYSRHVGGKLVTVRGYSQEHGGGRGNGTVRQIPRSKPHQLAAPKGVFQVRGNARFGYGLAPHAVFPAGRKHPVIFWSRNFNKNHGSFDPKKARVQLSAVSDWENEIQQAIDHINIVIQNNPNKPIENILQRQDVQQALSVAGRQAASAAISELQNEWQTLDAPNNTTYLNQVIQTLTQNGNTFAQRMTTAIEANSQQSIDTLLTRDSMRVAAAESVVQTRARNETQLKKFQNQGVTHIKWIARTIPGTNEFEPNVCTTCRALHGTVVNIGAQFNTQILTNNGLRVYGDLRLPPAHVNCRCKIVAA